jgi:tRNA(Ile)-lysidine synthase
MLKTFEKYLKQTCHCSPDKTFLLAVSGGIDSVVMADLFKKTGLEFAFAHCNFNLRADESDADQVFVEELASSMKSACYVGHFDTKAFAEEKGISIQMAARELRYDWFAKLKVKYGFDYVVIGHNLNDVVETMLLNLTRGSGIRGLSGIKPRQGYIVRPLLFASRDDIRKYAEQQHLPWREDSSNTETKYIRNRIRHTIIPELESINPSFMTNAMDMVTRLSQTEQLLNLAVSMVKKMVWIELEDKFLIDIEKLLEFPAVETLLYELLREFGCSPFNIRTIVSSFDSIPGKRFLTRTHCITRDRAHLIITKNTIPDDVEILIDQETAFVSYPVHLTFNSFNINPGYVIPAESRFAVLDSDQIEFPVRLRRWKPGDSFRPLGMKGSKKISDFLINNKVSRPDKHHIWVLESGRNIVWVINHRIDDRFRITSQTRHGLLIEYKSITAD